VTAQRELTSELDEVRRQNGWLRQHLDGEGEPEELRGVRSAEPRPKLEPAFPWSASRSVSSSQEIDAGLVGGADQYMPAEEELRILQANQAQAVNEALQVAWEAEAREHRSAQRRLQSLEACCLRPARQQLLRLADICTSWRHELLGLGAGQDRGRGDAGALPIVPSAQTLRALYDEDGAPGLRSLEDEQSFLRAQDLETRFSEAANAICACIEGLASESSRRLASLPAAAQAAVPQLPCCHGGSSAAARREPTAAESSGLQLRAERVALESELERLDLEARESARPQSHEPRGRRSSSLSRGVSFWGPAGAGVGSCDSSSVPPGSPGRTSSSAHQFQQSWPPSPRPRGHDDIIRGLGSTQRRGDGSSRESSVTLAAQEPRAAAFYGVGSASAWNASVAAPPGVGQLYRLDAREGASSTASRRSGTGKSPGLQLRGAAPVRQSGAPRQIAVGGRGSGSVSLDGLLDNPADRFDDYSLHRPLRSSRGLL
ncbi:unnamed protein product, partial [Polarella glacialis]